MYSKTELLQDIAEMGLEPSGTVLIHSSMKAIGEVQGGAETVLDTWCESMKDGLLVFPTHTWQQIGEKQPIFDSRTTPSCVGILSELFRHRSNVLRSLHPTHSVAALGRGAKPYVLGEESRHTPCPREGCWGKLLDLDATIVFLGCTLRSNTFIHGVEEWNHIPYRMTEEPQMLVSVDQEGVSHSVQMYRHFCPACSNISQHYAKLELPFRKLGAIRYRKYGDALCILGKARRMEAITSAFLKKEPQLFLDDNPIPENWYQ